MKKLIDRASPGRGAAISTARRFLVRLSPSVVGVVAALALAGASAGPSYGASAIVMSGLDAPRGLAFGPEGALYVAEAGRGGAGPCITVRGLPVCYGPTGAISRLWHGEQRRIVDGLPSTINAVGDVVGPMDISMLGRGAAYATIGFGTDPALRSQLGEAGHLFGNLIKVAASGEWRAVSDVSEYETEFNPAGGPLDSNPYGLLAESGHQVIADAGANALLERDANGNLSEIATFTSRPFASTDAVPTSVVRGPDGALYVGQLTGLPFTAGAANVYRIVPGQAAQVYLSGFKTIIDIALGLDGSLYVLQYATGPFLSGNGALIRVHPDGIRETITAALTQPTSVAFGPDGALYVSNRGNSVGIGEVIRIEP